jgi:hypothetical protein
MAGGRHPVRRKLDAGKRSDRSGSEVGESLAHRHAARGRGVEQRKRGALANGERLACIALVIGERDRAVGHRHLPGADELVARAQAADGAVADRHQEGLVRHGRVLQHAQRRGVQANLAEVEALQRRRCALHFAQHLRRFPEDELQLDVHGIRPGPRIGHYQAAVVGGGADHRERAALALADRLERRQILW